MEAGASAHSASTVATKVSGSSRYDFALCGRRPATGDWCLNPREKSVSGARRSPFITVICK